MMTWLGDLRPYVDLGKVVTGNLVRAILRGVLKIVVAGFLTPSALGIYRSIFSLFKMATSYADLGLDYALTTFVSVAIKKGDQDEPGRIQKAVLVMKMLTIVVVLIVGNAAAPLIAGRVLSDPSLVLYVRLAFVAAGGQLLWKYVSSSLSARQRFGSLALFLVTVPVVMWVAALVLIFLDRLSLTAVIGIYLFAPLLTAALWWPALKLGLRDIPWEPAVARRVLRFSRWIYVSSMASSTRNNINPILLKNQRLSGSVAAGELNAGLYSFGNDLANEVTIFSQSLLAVLLPKASSRTDAKGLRRLVLRSYLNLMVLLVPMALLVFAARPFLEFLGRINASYLAYLPSLPIFTILYLGALFSVASVPIQTALYAMNLPQVETYVETATIFLLIAGSVILIPMYGGKGAAIVVFAQPAITFSSLFTYGLYRLNRWKPEAD